MSGKPTVRSYGHVSKDDAESVTQAWYSLYLSQDVHTLVVGCLEDLVRISNLEVITRGIMKIDGDADQFDKLKEVWKTWLRLSIRQENNMSHQRRQIFATDAQDGMKSLLNEIPRRHRRSMTDWLSYGILLAEKKRKKATKENFTLLGSTLYPHNSTGPFVYNIESDCLPFNCWDYKDASAAYPELSDVTEMYNRYITDVLKSCIERLQQSDGIHISFILCDCTQVTNYIPDAMKFDRTDNVEPVGLHCSTKAVHPTEALAKSTQPVSSDTYRVTQLATTIPVS
ncbi:hypothetical protein QZH41_007230 [Actinostola sp. cb2023]|nr:hypothetical protein QZH41_007230 [Actinostola sp. cb2023]